MLDSLVNNQIPVELGCRSKIASKLYYPAKLKRPVLIWKAFSGFLQLSFGPFLFPRSRKWCDTISVILLLLL